MALHRLTRITVGVPDVDAACVLSRLRGSKTSARALATTDGGEQLELVAPRRRGLQQLGIGADDTDDLEPQWRRR